jgi:hypothetical protein
MEQEGVQSDSVTFVGLLNACTVALEEDMCVHDQISQSGCRSNAFVGNSLFDLHAKCWGMCAQWIVESGLDSNVFAQAIAWWTCMQNVEV